MALLPSSVSIRFASVARAASAALACEKQRLRRRCTAPAEMMDLELSS